MDLRDERELALQRLSKFCRAGFVSVTDFRHDPRRIFAAHELAALIDPSMATKVLAFVFCVCLFPGGVCCVLRAVLCCAQARDGGALSFAAALWHSPPPTDPPTQPQQTTQKKMTVQFNLFGGTVLKLGTEKHHQGLLRGIDQMESIGCFALTELGFGAVLFVCFMCVSGRG